MQQNPRYLLLQRLAIWLNLSTLLISLVVFAYLGYYSRFIADDYCFLTEGKHSSLWEALHWRYTNTSDRWANFMFINAFYAISGIKGMRFFPTFLIFSFLTGIITWLCQIQKRKPSIPEIVILLYFVFYIIWQSPQRFQTIYWYTSAATHFAPIATTPFLFAFLSWLEHHYAKIPWWMHTLSVLLFFLLGGFSEPPTAMLITAFTLAFLATFLNQSLARWRPLLLWPLVGLSLAMLVMILSPANSLRMDAPPPLRLFLYRLVRFPIDFIWDSLKTQPIPSALSFLSTLLLVLALRHEFPAISLPARKVIFIALLLLGIMYLFIAASFAPSIYGQSYPVARARFTARVIMTLVLMLEGALFGMVLSTIRSLQRSLLPLLLLLLLAFYPLRASMKIWQNELPEYQQRAVAWDARHARILAQIATGKRDIIVEQLNSFEQVKELDSDPRHWVNRCAAAYYGVESIQALPNYSP